MHSFVGARLSAMMFLQFFVWGAWYVTAPRFLSMIGFEEPDIGWTYSVGPIAGMISPFFVGMIADRFFATERVLALMHLLAGGAMIGSTFLMDPESPASPALINLVLFGHMLCYFPTLALTNTLAMKNMTDSEKQFPLIRVFGTIGWIVANLILGWQEWGGSINQFYLAGGSALLLGLYSFSLPHTPPPLAGQKVAARELLGLDALVMFRSRSFSMFMLSSFLICIPLAFYYQLAERAVTAAGLSDPPIKMSFGQMSEIFFMLAMPLFFARLGVTWMLLVGMGAWVLRYVLFAIGTPQDIAWMMLFGVVLHGICYDFFFVTGQIYTDKSAPAGIRAQAQGLLVLCTLGLGMFVGAQVAGYVGGMYTPPRAVELEAEVKEIGAQIAQLEKQTGTTPATAAKEQIAALKKESAEKSQLALELRNWKMIWAIPAIMAGVVMLLFALVFHEGGAFAPRDDATEGEVAEAAAAEKLV